MIRLSLLHVFLDLPTDRHRGQFYIHYLSSDLMYERQFLDYYHDPTEMFHVMILIHSTRICLTFIIATCNKDKCFKVLS